jgi:hypothetical protein
MLPSCDEPAHHRVWESRRTRRIERSGNRRVEVANLAPQAIAAATITVGSKCL